MDFKKTKYRKIEPKNVSVGDEDEMVEVEPDTQEEVEEVHNPIKVQQKKIKIWQPIDKDLVYNVKEEKFYSVAEVVCHMLNE